MKKKLGDVKDAFERFLIWYIKETIKEHEKETRDTKNPGINRLHRRKDIRTRARDQTIKGRKEKVRKRTKAKGI